ncbi:GNAT family N-acetyltransferase [Granulicella arctica]|uniref:GNAT family N-acetyltransferase n=1 Tax=Granulicella arctica TaxID=940613 RepID=UPI0021DF4E31|nr:GNAT family N-acetyltransferase [Granulicella arctica]
MMLDKEYDLVIGTPSAKEYRQLRVAAGLSPRSADAAEAGLPNTIFGVVIHCRGRLVGMGRVVGDGGLSFQLVDIAVEPEHQRRGLGKTIVRSLVDYVRKSASTGAHVSLLADGDAKHLYEKFGFVPTAPASVGMAFVVE